MSTIKINTRLLTKGKVVGPTIGGKKPFLLLQDSDKKIILSQIKRDWRQLIKLHFDAEGGITQDGKIVKWKPLSERHSKFKERNGYLAGTLEMNSPTLSSRYQRNIRSNVNNFQIYIEYPWLTYSLTTGSPVRADVHQIGRVKRPIIKASFITTAKKRIKEYLLK